ncbi:TPA: BlaI/MecI/CopY family transcriptional regulator [Clostridioides difficile]|nr:BlaI/MecI/CopY family transcriptional regulator [Clostridioides difficile]MCI4304787.1 BlaI/MecI/CopY family transcriptional regulator [Clostridioides difficile]MCM4101591.1 BlaI/MecI/CopY family transcriptional regulator [Clostridioides difficile]HDF4164021.1 BlaI/MecI/CopY family transcriptional regulator [Clostridioides difficile]
MIKIPNSEFKVMRFIWRSESNSITSMHISNAMNDMYGWKQTTTLTILSRLVKKGFLDSLKIGRYTHYTPIIRKQDYIEFETKFFFENIHDGSLKSLFKSLSNLELLSKKDIYFIKNWIERKKYL